MNIGSLRSSPVATMNRGHHPRPHLDHQQSEDPSHSTWTLVSSETSELQDHQPPGTPHTFHSAWSDGYVREDTPDGQSFTIHRQREFGQLMFPFTASSVLSGSQGSGVGPLGKSTCDKRFEMPTRHKHSQSFRSKSISTSPARLSSRYLRRKMGILSEGEVLSVMITSIKLSQPPWSTISKISKRTRCSSTTTQTRATVAIVLFRPVAAPNKQISPHLPVLSGETTRQTCR